MCTARWRAQRGAADGCTCRLGRRAGASSMLLVKAVMMMNTVISSGNPLVCNRTLALAGASAIGLPHAEVLFVTGGHHVHNSQ